MKIKVCGMRVGQNIIDVAALGVEWIGMVFNANSPRNVTMIPTCAGIIPDRASIDGLQPTGCKFRRVGVFTDEMAQNIITRVVNFSLDAIQLDGNESPTLIRNLRATLTSPGSNGIAIAPRLQIWKTIKVEHSEDVAAYKAYEDCVDMMVFDIKCQKAEGERPCWSIINNYDGKLPFLIGGDFRPDDANGLAAISHTLFAGIDIGTHFETAPAMKDVEKLREFIECVNSTKNLSPYQ